MFSGMAGAAVNLGVALFLRYRDRAAKPVNFLTPRSIHAIAVPQKSVHAAKLASGAMGAVAAARRSFGAGVHCQPVRPSAGAGTGSGSATALPCDDEEQIDLLLGSNPNPSVPRS